MDAVHDHAGERQAALGERAPEPDRLIGRLGLGRADEHESRGGGAQHLFHLLGAGSEILRHPAEQLEEGAEVADQVDAGDPPQPGEERADAAAEHPHADAGRTQERLQRTPLEERGQPSGSVEEVERVARRRRVEHEQVELVLLIEVVELRDRRELLRSRDRGRELAVDAIGLDLLGPRRARRDPLDQLVEGPLWVEHHRPQLALDPQALGGDPLGVDAPRLVGQLLESERVRESLGRIDRDHRDLQPAGRHAHRDRRRGRRLADPAGAGAHADPLSLEQLRDAHASASSRTSAIARSSSAPSSSANT